MRSPRSQAAAASVSVGKAWRKADWCVGTIAYARTERRQRSRTIDTSSSLPSKPQNESTTSISDGSRPASIAPARTRSTFCWTSVGGHQVKNTPSAIAPANRSIRSLIAASQIGRSASGSIVRRKLFVRSVSVSIETFWPLIAARNISMKSRVVAKGFVKFRPCQSPTTIGLEAPSPAAIRPGAIEDRVAKPIAARTGDLVVVGMIPEASRTRLVRAAIIPRVAITSAPEISPHTTVS